MFDKKGAKITIFLIIFIIEFSTEEQNVLYNYGLIITRRIFLKSFEFYFFDDY